ncbi:hypothetical protein CLOM_g5604, partial [Closterium sp. NIES-68]
MMEMVIVRTVAMATVVALARTVTRRVQKERSGSRPMVLVRMAGHLRSMEGQVVWEEEAWVMAWGAHEVEEDAMEGEVCAKCGLVLRSAHELSL